MAQFVTVINSYNRLALLRHSLQSLGDAVRGLPISQAIVISDGGSTDGTQAWVEAYSRSNPDVSVHFLKSPAGRLLSIAEGENVGCQFAWDNHPDLKYLFLYETDNQIRSVQPLLHAINLLEGMPNIAGVGFTVKKANGEPAGYGAPFPQVRDLILGPELTCLLTLDRPRVKWKSDLGIRFAFCDIVFTSPLILRSAVWKEIGGRDHLVFPNAGSDLDMCWKISLLGMKLAVLDDDRIIHDNLQVWSEWSGKRSLRQHRSSYLLLERYRADALFLIKPLLLMRHGLEVLVLLGLVALGRKPANRLKVRIQHLKTVFSNYNEPKTK